MITNKEFLQEKNKEEISAVIESFLNRLKGKDFEVLDKIENGTLKHNKKKLVILDKAKFRIIKEMIKDFKEYRK